MKENLAKMKIVHPSLFSPSAASFAAAASSLHLPPAEEYSGWKTLGKS
jgi:hypothetical protein